METAVIALSFTLLTLAVILAVLVGTVPWLWWRTLKLEQKVEDLDEVVAMLLEVAGVKPGAQPPAPVNNLPAMPPARVTK